MGVRGYVTGVALVCGRGLEPKPSLEKNQIFEGSLIFVVRHLMLRSASAMRALALRIWLICLRPSEK